MDFVRYELDAADVTREKTADEKLACAVILRAWQDMIDDKGVRSDSRHARQTLNDTQSAILFLTQEKGIWADKRNLMCEIGGFDSNALRERAKKWLNGDYGKLAFAEFQKKTRRKFTVNLDNQKGVKKIAASSLYGEFQSCKS